VKGIEVERHLIVAENFFPTREAGAYFARLFTAQKGGIEVLLIPGKPGCG
jgi:hypothetical protein